MDTLNQPSQTNWELDFPGVSPVLQTLRAAVIFAESSVLQSRSAFQALQTALGPLCDEMYNWHPRVLRRFNLLKRQHETDMRLFLTTLAALREAFAAKPDKKPDPPPVPPKPPVPKGPFYQNIEVTVVAGKVISEFDIGPRHWLKTRPVHLCDSWVRHYYFPNAEIPKEYEFVLEHNGLYYGPTRSVYISYPPDEFLRLCQLQVDTNSEHALDGQRVAYKRLSEEEPIERPRHEENQEG